jgi:DivIVA domain-containing protein
MALDRQSIEKRDFPIGRRGYEPEAVDEHLARLAEEFESLRRESGRRSAPESIAAVASQQVAAIVQAAETTAADLERQARDEAEHIRREAEAEAQQTRDDAVRRSQEHVGRVGDATAQMLQRVDAMESELKALVESLRTGASRLQADLSLLEGSMGELYAGGGAAAPPQRAQPIAAPPPPPAPAQAPPPPPPPAAAAPEPPAPPAPEPVAAAPAGGGGEDVEGARLIALNMALNGTSRDETARYLAENFDLSDRDSLLDEVYASVEG